MKKIIILLLAGFLLMTLSAEITVDKIIEDFREVIRVPNLTGTFKVTMISQKGDVREIEATAYQKLVSEKETNRLFIFNFPPTVRDTALLVHSFADSSGENNMWIYLPAVRRVKRIALEQAGGGYFMGSDFSYSDLMTRNFETTIMEYMGEEVIDERNCYAVKDYDRDPKVQQEMGYSHTINYYSIEDHFLYARDYYDFSGKLLKTYRVKEVFATDDFIYPTIVEMHNVQSDHRSIIEVSDYSVDEIPDRYFSTRNLTNR